MNSKFETKYSPTVAGDMNQYREEKPRLLLRLIWRLINATLFRLLIGVKLHSVRNGLLRLFGAKVPDRALIYASCKIFAPWNLEVGKFAAIGPNTEIYNKASIVIGANAIVSQGAFLCTASHDISDPLLPLTAAPITIGERAWVAADAFIGPGVTVGEGAVVGARAAVFRDVEAWTVVGGNPAKFIKQRILNNGSSELSKNNQ